MHYFKLILMSEGIILSVFNLQYQSSPSLRTVELADINLNQKVPQSYLE